MILYIFVNSFEEAKMLQVVLQHVATGEERNGC